MGGYGNVAEYIAKTISLMCVGDIVNSIFLETTLNGH